MNPQWYVLYTRHGWETKVAGRLTDQQLDHYCPLTRLERPGRRKHTTGALFPSWVFVKADSTQLPAIRQLKGVVNLVYWLGKPATIPGNEMMAMMDFVNSHTDIIMDKPGVSLNHAPQQSVPLSIASLDQYQLETLLIPSLGVSLSAMVKLPVLELVNAATPMPAKLPALRYAMS
jgi:transcription antitermination factor NusG